MTQFPGTDIPTLDSSKDTVAVRKSILDLLNKINQTYDEILSVASSVTSLQNSLNSETFTEYLFNKQSTINTNDTTSFGSGSGGTPLLANTATTYYDIKPSSIGASDSFVLQFKDKNTGAWIDAILAGDLATAGQYGQYTAGLQDSSQSAGCGLTVSSISGQIRVFFNAVAYTISGLGSRLWSQVIASYYTAWRVKHTAT